MSLINKKNSSRDRPRTKRRNQAFSKQSFVHRTRSAQIFLYVMALGVTLRLIYVQIYRNDHYASLASEQYMREYTLHAPRGMVFDRNGMTVALNKERYDLTVNKRAVTDINQLAEQLAEVTGNSKKSISDKLSKQKSYAVLNRNIDSELATVIESSKFPGVQIIESSERHYPFKHVSAQVIGFSDIDGKGLSGVELQYDHILAGKDGWSILQKDARGKSVMPITARTKESVRGDNVILTIDNSMQTIAEEEISRAVKKRNAIDGTAIITNPGTGEILAMASAPGFDANNVGSTSPNAWRIRSITDIFEPGSTFKVVTLMLALQDSSIKESDLIFCENGSIQLFGETINDSEKHAWLSVLDIFKHSSNIGTAKLAMQIGKEKLYRAARNFGFGNKTGIGLPGEVGGILKRTPDWSKLTTAAMSYGHEVAVTALQMAMAYGAIANGGMLMKPAILKEIQTADGIPLHQFRPQIIRNIMDARTAEKMTQVLISVVEDGSGINAKIPGVKLAGKTGTAQKPNPLTGGYSNRNFVASFVGYYPANQAKLLIYVSVDEPYPVHSGGSVAAPVVRRILERIINVYETQKPTQNPIFTKIEPVEQSLIPDVKGRRIEVAQKVLEEGGIGYRLEGNGIFVSSQASDDQGVILKLQPVDLASEYTKMPDLTGLSIREAVAKLSVRGLRVKIKGSGKVDSQEPKPKTEMKVGSRCYLTCSPVIAIDEINIGAM